MTETTPDPADVHTGTDRVELTDAERCNFPHPVHPERLCERPAGHDTHSRPGDAWVTDHEAWQALTAERDDLRARLNAANARYRLDFAERNLNRHERDRAYAERDAARAELAAANTRCAELERMTVNVPADIASENADLQATLDRVTATFKRYEDQGYAVVRFYGDDQCASTAIWAVLREAGIDLRAALTPEGKE